MTKQKGIESFQSYLQHVSIAGEFEKSEWIKGIVKGKHVLDLGIVNHDLEDSLANQKDWLHGLIRKEAMSVVGVDILDEAIQSLSREGFDVVAGDALTVRLDRKFDVVVCGDLIEHVRDPLALLETIDFHLAPEGVGIISTPNPFSALRMLGMVATGETEVNEEHVMWLCPKTIYQLVDRSRMKILDFVWLRTKYVPGVRRRYFQRAGAILGSILVKSRPVMRNDFGIVIQKS